MSRVAGHGRGGPVRPMRKAGLTAFAKGYGGQEDLRHTYDGSLTAFAEATAVKKAAPTEGLKTCAR